jgi:hypothetical protein
LRVVAYSKIGATRYGVRLGEFIMKNNAKLRHFVFSAVHGLGFTALLTGSVLVLFFLVAIPIARASGLHEWPAAILATAIYAGLQWLVAWKFLMPYMEWLEPRLCPCFAQKNTRWI